MGCRLIRLREKFLFDSCSFMRLRRVAKNDVLPRHILITKLSSATCLRCYNDEALASLMVIFRTSFSILIYISSYCHSVITYSLSRVSNISSISSFQSMEIAQENIPDYNEISRDDLFMLSLKNEYLGYLDLH